MPGVRGCSTGAAPGAGSKSPLALEVGVGQELELLSRVEGMVALPFPLPPPPHSPVARVIREWFCTRATRFDRCDYGAPR